MKVEVEQGDIDESLAQMALSPIEHARSCPVVVSMRRADGKPWIVSSHVAWVDGLWPHSRELLPDVAQQFIRAFDKGQKVGPIAFETTKEPPT